MPLKLSTLFLLFLLVLFPVAYGRAASMDIESRWGGHVKVTVTATDYEADALQGQYHEDPWLDYGLNARLNHTTFLGPRVSFACHYQLISYAGDTWETPTFTPLFSGGDVRGDSTALLDLSGRIRTRADYGVYHRIDRLNASLETDTARVVLGRQAVTWGNGLLFNPQDVFSPFSPYEIDRDYKTGADMAYLQAFLKTGDDIECLYVPRRDLETGDVAADHSSLAVRFHHFADRLEFGFMAAAHFADAMVGIGCSGYLGGAVWRTDIVYTAGGGDTPENYVSFVANIDYSWVWQNRNWYGLAEFFYSGIGEASSADALASADLCTRISRGDLFTLGRAYLGAGVQVELTALLTSGLTVIANLDDGSALLQPKAVWDAAENLELTVGGNLGVGGRGEEYGQITLLSDDSGIDCGDAVFLWVTRFF